MFVLTKQNNIHTREFGSFRESKHLQYSAALLVKDFAAFYNLNKIV